MDKLKAKRKSLHTCGTLHDKISVKMSFHLRACGGGGKEADDPRLSRNPTVRVSTVTGLPVTSRIHVTSLSRIRNLGRRVACSLSACTASRNLRSRSTIEAQSFTSPLIQTQYMRKARLIRGAIRRVLRARAPIGTFEFVDLFPHLHGAGESSRAVLRDMWAFTKPHFLQDRTPDQFTHHDQFTQDRTQPVNHIQLRTPG